MLSMMTEDETIQDMQSTSSGSAGESCLLDIQDDDEVDQDEEYEMVILCELVGARDLCIPPDQDVGDLELDALQPFCVVKFGDRIIHKSNVACALGANPIWTLSNKSMFLLRTKPSEIANGILSVGIYSQRATSLSARFKMENNRLPLGHVTIGSNEILSRCNRERFEMCITDDMGTDRPYRGKIALRFQVATESDQQIVELFNQDANLSKSHSRRELTRRLSENPHTRQQAVLCTEIDEREIAHGNFVSALNSVCSTRSVTDTETGKKMVKVKPYPDPQREGETSFMLSNDINVETRLPSHKWVEGGSGTLGKLYCEILACHNLPNVDMGEFMGNVTDPFVSLVYEDTCAMTDVINDELSPHWLPWTQRAFCFGMMHPASILYVGVFDYDLATSHEPIGRVAVNVSNLQRNTVHTLKYSLYPSSNVTDRTAVGSITIRIRIDCPDDKAALMAALKPRPKIFVNVKKPKSFKVVRYTCYGEYDGEETFDMTVMRSYINEVFEYKAAFGYAVRDALTSLVFWRGQVEVFSTMVPLYSLLFFCMAADFVERPFMFIPYLCFGIAGVMFGNLNVRRRHPSPWNRCPSFWHYLHILVIGKAPALVESINKYEGHEKAEAYEKEWQDRIEHDLILAEKRLKLQQELDEIGDDNISTKLSPSAIPVDILARLTRYQGMAGRYCGYMRFVKVIVTWEESIVSFWITAVFLAIGFTTMLLPWRFILTWTGRLIVWCFLGPHMKAVDIYQQAHRKDGMLSDFVQQFNLARVRREEALKQKVIKAIAFGKYSTQVPSFNIARHFDRPLPESSARICRQTSKNGSNRMVSGVGLNEGHHVWIPGQQLYGAMIPRPERDARLHEIELLRQTDKLARFRSLVNKSIEMNGMEARREKFAPNKLEFDSREPLALGYEVIPDFHGSGTDDNHAVTDDVLERKRLTVVLTTSDKPSPGIANEVELLLESDGKSVYEVKQEGVYVEEDDTDIASNGRFNTVSQDHEDGTEITIVDRPTRTVTKNKEDGGTEVASLGRYQATSKHQEDDPAVLEERDSPLALMYKEFSNARGIAHDTPGEILVQSITI